VSVCECESVCECVKEGERVRASERECSTVARSTRPRTWPELSYRKGEFFIGNLLVRIHFIIAMIRWTGLAPWEFEFHFPGSLTSTFLCTLIHVFFALVTGPRRSLSLMLSDTKVYERQIRARLIDVSECVCGSVREYV